MYKKYLSAVILVLYCLVLLKLMVFKDLPLIRLGSLMLNFGGSHEGAANLVPFKTIWPYLRGEKGWLIAGINLAGNIVLLVPIGFLAPLVFTRINAKRSLVLAIASGMLIESTQLYLHVGIFDIDDVILNALGVMTGYWLYCGFATSISTLPGKFFTGLAVVAIAAVTLCLFFLYQGQPKQPLTSGYPQQRITDSVNEGVQPEEATIPSAGDPCNGTGGTGRIASMEKNTIVLERNDGIQQTIEITGQTLIRNAAGALSEQDLRVGDRVTLVTTSNNGKKMVADSILVCR